MTENKKNIPPGNNGWPLLGQTLTFLKNSFQFIKKGVAKHGPVFRSNILGRKAAIVVGPEACARWIDPECVIREGAMPPNIQELFGGGDVLPLLDGEVHKTRKSIVLEGFTRDMLNTYIAGQQETIERYMERWADQKEFQWVPELKSLAIEGVCSNVMGIEPGPDLDALLEDYGFVGGGFASLPIPLPGTGYTKALKARDRILTYFETIVRDHQANPTEDGLSKILAARAPEGTQIAPDDAKREMHHVVIAGLIIWAQFAAIAVHLSEQEEVLSRLKAEVQAQSPEGPITPNQLRSMPYLLQFVMEVKRICPMIPVQFGIAKNDFELYGYTIPKDWMVLWAVTAGNHFEEIYPNPETFDPERFGEQRAEHKKHEHAFAPQGPGPDLGHKCPGTDFATLFMQMFTILLVRNYSWKIPKQNMNYKWNLIPPEYKDGLHIQFEKS